MIAVAMETVFILYRLVCVVFEAQAEVVLLQQVEGLTDFEEQVLALGPFLQESKSSRDI